MYSCSACSAVMPDSATFFHSLCLALPCINALASCSVILLLYSSGPKLEYAMTRYEYRRPIRFVSLLCIDSFFYSSFSFSRPDKQSEKNKDDCALFIACRPAAANALPKIWAPTRTIWIRALGEDCKMRVGDCLHYEDINFVLTMQSVCGDPCPKVPARSAL